MTRRTKKQIERARRRDEEWKSLEGERYQGKLSGNALFAREVHATPLNAQDILGLVMRNLHYFNDSYYDVLTRPVEMRVEEFYDSIGQEVPCDS